MEQELFKGACLVQTTSLASNLQCLHSVLFSASFFFSSLSSHKVHLNYWPRSASDTGFVCSCRHCEHYTSALQFCIASCQVKEMCCCDHSRPRTQQVNLAAAFSWQHSCVHTRYLLAELHRVGVILIFFFLFNLS